MPLPLLRDLPYLVPRVIRRKCFPTAIPRVLSAWLPGFRANAGTRSCARVLNLYDKYLKERLGTSWPGGRRILEVGIGATNSSAYEAVALGAKSAVAFEPFVALDPALDAPLLAECAQRHGLAAETIAAGVRRVTALDELTAASIDLILSNSVLEHVGDMDALASGLARVLAPGGSMLHLVDYRDHYFRYPYHHLLWSDEVWARWLNPGDLPRWRISDHVKCFERHGFGVEILRATSLVAEFEKVRDRFHSRFDGYDEDAMSTAFGVLYLSSRADGAPPMA
jgi:SAM-dependent methyltransferase